MQESGQNSVPGSSLIFHASAAILHFTAAGSDMGLRLAATRPEERSNEERVFESRESGLLEWMLLRGRNHCYWED